MSEGKTESTTRRGLTGALFFLVCGAFLCGALATACGSSGDDGGETTSGWGGTSSTSGGASGASNDQAAQEAMGLAEQLRAEYVDLKSRHEALWQERIAIATGPDLDTIGPRYAEVNAVFTARADQAWQAMNSAVGYVRRGELDGFRQYINESRSHVAVLRQMVEAIEGELIQIRGAAAAPAGPEAAPAAGGGQAPSAAP